MAWQVTTSVDTSSIFIAECGVYTHTEVGNSGFAAKTRFQASPLSAGSFMFQPAEIGHDFAMPVTVTNDKRCDNTFVTNQGSRPVVEGLAYVLTAPGLTPLIPLPNDPGHFVGSTTILHDEQPLPGGAQVIDLAVSWDLRRTPER